ncbi:hypothetical protein ACQ4PT_069289 [Festuca glaucescens]
MDTQTAKVALQRQWLPKHHQQRQDNFHQAGVQPPDSNVAVSPLLAWHDAISDHNITFSEEIEVPIKDIESSEVMNQVYYVDRLSDLGFVSTSVTAPVVSSKLSAVLVPESTSVAHGSHLDTSIPVKDHMSVAVSAGSVMPAPVLVNDIMSAAVSAGLVMPPSVCACGHLRKINTTATTPSVDSQVRRSTRQNNDGYLYELPNSTRLCSSLVPRAEPPAILQITEMQPRGIEDCLIDPSELTEEHLLQEHQAK